VVLSCSISEWRIVDTGVVDSTDRLSAWPGAESLCAMLEDPSVTLEKPMLRA
jgi:hypothetical protein